jgi:putative hemolysin
MLPVFVLPAIVAGLLLGSALLSASETALFALVRMEHTRERLRAPVRHALERLLRRPAESLVVIIGLNETCNVFAECLGTSFLLLVLGPMGAYVAAPVMLVLIVLMVEITPKTFALGFPHLIASFTARPLAFAVEVVHPIARYFAPPIQAPRPEAVSESEFKALLSVSEHQGEVAPAERELIHKVFEFTNRRVADVMTPRERIFSLDINTPPERLIGEVARGRFSRVPIWRGDAGRIVGVLHAKDLVARRLDPVLPRLERLIRPPYFVPPRKPLGVLLDEMRRDRIHLAVVVNEYGALLGVVSLEDLLEELFGEIKDEFDVEGPELTRTDSGEWLVAGGIELSRLQEALGREHLPAIDGGGETTLSRLVLRRLGRVPRPGESFALGGYKATVEKVRGASIEQLRLVR